MTANVVLYHTSEPKHFYEVEIMGFLLGGQVEFKVGRDHYIVSPPYMMVEVRGAEK